MLKLRQKLFFGTGSLGKDLFNGIITAYLMVFYTDVFGLTASLAGLVLLITKLVDGVSNPLIGMMIDRTNTRFGKFRPYFLIVPIPFAVFTILTFTAPDMSEGMKFIYALITYNLAGICFTVFDVSYWGIVPSLTKDPKVRTELISYGRVFTAVGGLIVSTFALPIIQFFGKGEDKTGYFYLAVIVAVVGSIFSFSTFFNTKEQYTTKTEPPTFKEYFKVIFNNKGVLSVVTIVLSYGLCFGLQNAVGVYYLKYYMKQPELIPLYMFLTLGGKVIGSIVAPIFTKRWGNKHTTIRAFIGVFALSLIMFFAPIQHPWVYFSLAVLITFCIGLVLVSMTALMADLADLTEYTTGKRSDGVLFSLNALSIQIGFAVSAGVAGILLDSTGYVANQVIQNDATLLCINLMRTIGPGLVCILALFMIRYYPINSNQELETIYTELDKKNRSAI
ncbi:glycoside-pentoside-hexuronide (GPH):cation symporter [Ectobacillus funiculus]|uniref:MFS transporter n=1 Tax=Ectobacillus funiculus TaxID=137993 RepID=UPI00397B43FD